MIPIKDYPGPRRRIPWVTWGLIFFTIITLPAFILIGIWFLLQFFDGVTSLTNTQQAMGGVAYFAHVEGFVTGLVITLVLRPMLQPPPNITYPPFPRHPNSMGPVKW